MDDSRITRGRVIPARGCSAKMIGKNAQLDDHGVESRDPLVVLETDAGLMGLGRRRGRPETLEEELSQVLGRPVGAFYQDGVGVRLTACEFAIWDLAAKAREIPVYALLGGGPGGVPAYDGSLYFCDLLYPDRPLERLREEAQEAVGRGFRQIKMKIGRGYRWMSPTKGFRRDVEAVQVVREAVGPEVKLMVDGNNGFDREGAIRLFKEIGPLDIYWAEEMFPETLEDCRALKDFLRENGWATLIADGETQCQIEPLLPLMETGVLEVQQLDINTIGLTEWMRVAHLCGELGCGVAPHTWGSQLGLFHSLHLARACGHFLSAEVPAHQVDAILPAGIEWHGGCYHLNAMPGWGLIVNERVVHEEYGNDITVYE